MAFDEMEDMPPHMTFMPHHIDIIDNYIYLEYFYYLMTLYLRFNVIQRSHKVTFNFKNTYFLRYILYLKSDLIKILCKY